MQSDISLAPYIDHTLLKPDARQEQVQKICEEALRYGFFSVCVNSVYVKFCAENLQNSNVKVCSVVGFPLGAMDTHSKAFETKQAVQNGASEIDMVIHIGALKDQNYDYVRDDIAAVVQAAQGRQVKVIIETALLSRDEKIMACRLAKDAGAHFVKTCTGFNGGGATVEDIMLMTESVDGMLQVKASGGIKDAAQAMALIRAGATRLGTSSGVALAQGQKSQGGY